MADNEQLSQDFRAQPVWRQAFHLTIDVYRITGSFPSLERWDGLATIMRKCASALGAHIAEACSYPRRVEAALFFQMALGGASELLHHVLVSRELGYVGADQAVQLENEIAAVRHMLLVHLKELGADAIPVNEPVF